ncbi:MAG: hypothetical protein BWX88_03335 [Planctomycetes bacterium ADurb.Bin126]|mgnify:FL=1|nr:MAG: hypothetical protein BWX88_03335 [Planctomycetes bacterium ADurb.Bin126]HOD80693.1 hypothetical protein [Phycisphaerae bacterium]HQL74991.1 hypothetical protein [Phycisphaerae bacterium]
MNVGYYAIKLLRLSGWLLLPVMVLYVLTGFALCGKLGFEKLMDVQTALAIHQVFDWPLVGLFVLHAAAGVYLSFRRWGWIRRRKT